MTFAYLLCPIIPQFEKSLDRTDPEIRDLHNFGTQLGQNCSFGLREEFLANYTSMFFIYLLSPIVLQSLKKTFTLILRYRFA